MNNHEVKGKIDEAFEKFCEELNLEPWDDVECYVAAHLKGCIARAYVRGNRSIEIDLWRMVTRPDKIEEVVAHELCHIVHPNNHHGREWKEEMKKLGFEGLTKDQWDTSIESAFKNSYNN